MKKKKPPIFLNQDPMAAKSFKKWITSELAKLSGTWKVRDKTDGAALWWTIRVCDKMKILVDFALNKNWHKKKKKQ